ncbi:MAG TPA: FUSC family protein [Porphyromonadaceae bacterium]|nr:FUSC family protein [Porphyromonadaceae bacterium]
MKTGINDMKRALSAIWSNLFWKNPAHLWALKVTLSIAFLLIPAELLLHNSFIGTTLALGVVAMALGETDVHPRGRMKSAGIALLLFFLISSITELTLPYPAIFAPVLAIMAFILVLVGGIDSRLQGVTFGSLLILVYTMLGAGNSDKWFHQPLLLTAGALCYSMVSILLLYHRPYRLLTDQLSRGFSYLAEYIELKAGLFPSNPAMQRSIRNQLAQKNTQLAQQIEACKNDLYSYSEESSPDAQSQLSSYYRKWFLLQEMQERVISSHEQYDLLTEQVKNSELIEGFGQLMRELAKAIALYAESMITGEPYRHPLSLRWTVLAMQRMLEDEKGEAHHLTLSLLMRNLIGLEKNLRENEESGSQIDLSAFYARKPERKRLRELLTPTHPRFRFAVRLTLGWLLGYGMMLLLHFEKGAWILLTSLIVFQQTYSATRMRLFHRVLGTLLGVILGVALAQLLPTHAGHILLLLGSIYAFFYWLKKNYTIAAIFITTFVLAVFNLLSSQGVEVMLPRITDTLIGGAIAYLVVRFVWPDWQYKQLPSLLYTAVVKSKRYFESIYDGSVSDEEYQHNRRQAYNADNALTSAWKGMRLEPKNSRQYEENAFNLTNLNHALLSYISAFGVHKHSEDLTEEERLFCQKVSGVLHYAAELLTGNADQSRLDALLQEASCWEERIEELQNKKANRRAGLIYNIAHVSRELLIETKGILNSKSK